MTISTTLRAGLRTGADCPAPGCGGRLRTARDDDGVWWAQCQYYCADPTCRRGPDSCSEHDACCDCASGGCCDCCDCQHTCHPCCEERRPLSEAERMRALGQPSLALF